MTRTIAAVLVAGMLALPGGATAEETRTWTSADTFSETETWWSVSLEERLTIGSAETSLFDSASAMTAGFGVMVLANLNHHWSVGGHFALDFQVSPSVTDAFAAVNTTYSNIDTTIAFEVGYQPLALAWMVLGVTVDLGVLIDSTSVESGGSSWQSLTAALGLIGGYANIGFFPVDAFEIGIRGGYRYLLGTRADVPSADADRMHIPAGPYRGLGDGVVTIYETLHF
jgi:hypothetical protein